MNWIAEKLASLSTEFRDKAVEQQSQLTKPPGSLGRLEQIAIQMAAMQATTQPHLHNIYISVFAGDHGVADEGVSAFPQAVTAEMVKNFARGGAAINVLAKSIGATLEVVNLGTVAAVDTYENVLSRSIAPATANFVHGPAMTTEQLEQAMEEGAQAIMRAIANEADAFIGGEMGIANTTAASAMACALLKRPATMLAGPGTGLNKDGVRHKVQVIDKGLHNNKARLTSPLACLRCLGGFEIAALCGAYIKAAQVGLPIIVDGFISSTAALAAVKINPEVRDWMIFSHASAEPGHQIIVQALDAKPLLNLNMRLGEGSGAATAVPLIRLALATHNDMATFAEAGVSEKLK
ncbi:MAG: nicotinate-nucleotide--dimethylbenzimidazole phosphoribosyltransferase [Gammaproteobacteria bacterium]|nr:nicotinate-nucleotide--dimethylbenzimidazole phosphoribosyltransferase [Gammaproteobacteria bacterium]